MVMRTVSDYIASVYAGFKCIRIFRYSFYSFRCCLDFRIIRISSGAQLENRAGCFLPGRLARIAAMIPMTRLRPSSTKPPYHVRFIFAIGLL